jgi:hypothetical protein
VVDYVKLAATALRLVDKNGKTITVRKLAGTAADPTKPWRGPADPRSPTADSQDVRAVEVGVDTLTKMGKVIKKTDIPDNVEKCYIVAPGLATPALDDFDEVIDGDVQARIVLMKPLKPADTVLIYVIGTCS